MFPARCLPTDASPAVLQLHMGLFPRDEAKGWSGCPLQSLPGQGHPTGRTRLPRNGHSCPSAAAQSLAAPASPPASHQRGLSPKLGCFPAVSVWGTFFLPQSLPHGREFRQSCPASPQHHRARDAFTASSDWNHREVFPAVHGWLTDLSSSSCDPTTSLEMVILVREAASSDR